uniref:Uncharacterized protein n=1 Tax=Tanacetum cinerariifolium TaxID=118510 RepID=A0A6L2K7H5_TANCI|nr:hypothetical protein [Tanacetum cinerariifolium]
MENRIKALELCLKKKKDKNLHLDPPFALALNPINPNPCFFVLLPCPMRFFKIAKVAMGFVRETHIDYLKYSQEQDDILWGIVKQVKAKQPLDNALDFACCFHTQNKVKKVRFAEPLTSSSNIKLVESSKPSDSNTIVLSPTRLKCSTSNYGSYPIGNIKNDRISQTPSRNMKNKVEAQPRNVNKKNRVVEPILNVDVKRSQLNANSDLICATCKKFMFDSVHDLCIIDFVKNVNSHAKSANKHKKQNIWKPTGHVFTKVGFMWKPTGRTFTIIGNSCPLTRITSANIVTPKKTTSHSVKTQKPKLKVNMNTIATQQAALDNALVPYEKRLKIEGCNARICIQQDTKGRNISSTLKFVAKIVDYQKYGALITDGMINEYIKLSAAFQTYLDFATRKFPPKKERKFKKLASPKLKTVPASPKEPTHKVKQVKRPAKKATTAPNNCKDESNDVHDEDKDDNDDDDGNDDDSGNDDDGGGNDAQDSERTDSDDDENPSFTLEDYKKEEQDEEYVHTPKKDKSDDEENMYEEEDDDVAKEFYRYLNITQGLTDTDMTNSKQGGAYQQNASHESGFVHKEEDAHVTLTTIHDKTEGPLQSSSVSSDFTSKLQNLDDPSLDINSLMNTSTVPPPPPPVNPSSHAIIKERVKAQVSKIMPQIKKYVTESLGDEVLTNESINKSDIQRNLYNALVESYNINKDILSTYGDVVTLNRGQVDQDKDEDPSTGSDRGMKRRKSSKDVELSKGSKSKEESHLALPKAPNLILNPWIDNLNQEILVERGFNLLKGTCKSFVELEYNFEECYIAVNDKLDWNNLEGHAYPFDLSKTLSLIEDQGRQHTTNMLSGERITRVRKDKDSMHMHATGNLHMMSTPKEEYYGNFPRLNLFDIEDMILLLVLKKLSNLDVDDRYDFGVALRMFTRHIIILHRVKDLQLRVESCQKKLNITRPETFRSDIPNMIPYTTYKNPQGIIYQGKTVLHDIAYSLEIYYLPKRHWSNQEKKRSRIMIKEFDKLLFEMRLMRNLEKFIGGKEYENDLRLLERTI